jgi:hypothetical protein
MVVNDKPQKPKPPIRPEVPRRPPRVVEASRRGMKASRKGLYDLEVGPPEDHVCQTFATALLSASRVKLLKERNPALAGLLCHRAGRTRTYNPRFWRPVLCQLSYGPRRSA